MRLLLFLLLTISSALAQDTPPDHNASSKSLEALMAVPIIKTTRLAAEKKALTMIPLQKDTIVLTYGIGTCIAKSKIDTKTFTKAQINLLGGKFRPDLEYRFTDKVYTGTINIRWNF